MNIFSTSPLSLSGLPILYNFEVELKSEDQVSIVLQKDNKFIHDLYPPGLLILTNFRLIIIVAEQGNTKPVNIGWGIELKQIKCVQDCTTKFKKSTRITIILSTANETTEIGVKFNNNAKDEFILMLSKAIENKSWDKPTISSSTKTFSSSNAGVAGIIRRQEQNIQSVEVLTKSALTDLDTLMLKAREAVQIVQRYANYIDIDSLNNDNNEDRYSETTSQVGERNEMETILQNIGIISPVTKFSAGRLYHQQLAKQIADILLQHDRLIRLGGMITLNDLYCILNKTRGTELVSPEDLLKASHLITKLSLGIDFHVFESGVKVIKLNTYNDYIISNKILNLLNQHDNKLSSCIQASDVALHLNVSIIIAKEQLLICEKNEYICRDESIEGLYYYLNSFKSKWNHIS